MSSISSTSRVAVQCAVQPGLAAVFDAVICRTDDASLHIVPVPEELVGKLAPRKQRLSLHLVFLDLLQVLSIATCSCRISV